MSTTYKSQHEPPAFTLATIGHPANGRVIVKTEDGYWRNVHDGRVVADEDFRAGWQPFQPSAPRSAVEYITTSAAAQMLGCSVRTIYRRLDDGELTKHTSGRRILLDRAEVEALIKPDKQGRIQSVPCGDLA